MNPVDSPIFGASMIPEYQYRIEFWAILGCVVMFVAIIELVRRNRLKERYSFLWFLTAGVLLVFTIKRNWLEDLARMIGVYYPPTALFLILVFFLILILIHFSTVISRLLNDKQVLAQQLGILDAKMKALERDLGARTTHDEQTSNNEG